MILRKPYAFFIKHFRLIHIILAVLVCFSVYHTKIIMDFFNQYAATLINVVGQDLTGTLMPGIIHILPLIIILFTTMIMAVMIAKKKPFPFYIINILIFIFSFVILQITKSTLLSMESALIDIRTARLVRDLVTVSFIAQLVSAFILIIRGTGFNFKKFGFKEDLQDLAIEEEDREEFEVDLSLDRNQLKRRIRRFLRYAKYTYKENKLAIILGSTIILIGLGAFIFVKIQSREIKMEYNTYFTGNRFTISLLESYITSTDYKGKTIDKDDIYVILKIKVKNNTNNTGGLDLATTKLVIGTYSYTPTNTNRDSFLEFGDIYEGEDIGKDYEYKTLLYKIPKELKEQPMTFYFVDKNSVQKDGLFKKTYVYLQLEDLDKEPTTITTSVSNPILFDESVISNYQLIINSFDIQKQYQLNYNYCIKQDCYPSIEYLKPSITSNYEKALLKINGRVEGTIRNVYNLYDFIEKFGTLTYTIENKEYTQNVQFKEIISKRVKEENTYYIEVKEEILTAEHITFKFKIKNKTYEYVLK